MMKTEKMKLKKIKDTITRKMAIKNITISKIKMNWMMLKKKMLKEMKK